MRHYRMCLSVAVGVLLAPLAGQAADWPTYRGDNARRGATTETLAFPQSTAWTVSAPAVPRLAWSSAEGRVIEGKLIGHRVRYDDAFRVVSADGRVYFGSTVDHHLHCVDLKTGRTLWTFATGGPIRLAPTLSEGRVLFGSDDGNVYCLNAVDGALHWQRRIGPADEWLLARGEMISKWPVRTGVLVQDGVAYCGAGIFPHEDVYLSGLDVATGRQVWKSHNISAQDAGRNDLSPQGYLLATEQMLFVPSGRSLPAAFDLETGKLVHKRTHSWRSTAGGVVGGFRAVLADGQLYTSGPHHFLAMTQERGDVGFGWFEGRQLVIDGDQAYAVTGTHVLRMEREAYAVNSRVRHQLEDDIYRLGRALGSQKGDEAEATRTKRDAAVRQLKEIADVGIAWRAETTDDLALLVTGAHVLVGGPDRVTAYDKSSGEVIWARDVDGGVRDLVAVGGRLIASTDLGQVICFAAGQEPLVPDAQPDPEPAAQTAAADSEVDPNADAIRRAARQILEKTGIRKGYCLVAGSQRGALAEELARLSELKIYCVEPDARKVQAARQRLLAANLYGHRVTVHQWALDEIPYSNYFANLIVSETALREGRYPGAVNRLARHLKPVGGQLCLSGPEPSSSGDARAQLEAWHAALGLEDQASSQQDGRWLLVRRGPLPGAGDWSHQYGNPGNTAVSEDTRITGDLGVLWYGDPGPDDMVNRHEGAVGPLSVNGRLFVQGESTIKAYDAYNGVHLWTYENPEALRTGVFQNQNPGNLAAGENNLFHFVGDKCLQVDAATGEQIAIHTLPPGKDDGKHEWGYVAVQDDLLFGTATIRAALAASLRRRGRVVDDSTDAIFAIHIPSGKHLWSWQGQNISHHTIAIGPDKVCFIDSSITSEQREALLRQDRSELAQLEGEERELAEARLKQADMRVAVALDARTGKQLWSNPVDVTDCSDIGIGGGKLTMMYADGKLVLGGANANGHYWRQFVAGEFSRRRLVVLDAENGYKLWAKDANYRHRPIVIGKNILAEPWMFNLEHGEQFMRTHPITGEQVPWSIMRTGHHCGMITGAESGMLVFRSGHTGFFDLNSDDGVRHFAGHRLGCWINAITANGLVLIPEASAGCVCQFSIASTIVLEPREARRPWTIYSAVGAQTPVKHLTLNLGAPGDRKDALGRVWLSFPRYSAYQETSLDVKLDLQPQFAQGGDFSSKAELQVQAPEHPWVYTSWAEGLEKLSLPLLGAQEAPARYTLRLHFAQLDPAVTAPVRISLRVNGTPLEDRIEVPARQGDQITPVVHEFHGIAVDGRATIELTADGGRPFLNAVEAIRESE